jgi:hypothetical protein
VTFPDKDDNAELRAWKGRSARGGGPMSGPLLSIVIPTFSRAEPLYRLVAALDYNESVNPF